MCSLLLEIRGYKPDNLLSAIGISLGYISSVVVIGRMFTGQKRVLYLSIQTAFTSLSGLIYPYILEWLIDFYGLDEMYLLLGAFYCNKIPFLILCIFNRKSIDKAPENDDNTNTTTENPSDNSKENIIATIAKKFKQMMNTTFLLLLIASGVSIAGNNGFLGLVLDISLWKGFTTSQGLFTFVILNIINTLFRLVPGFLKQLKEFDSLIYPIISGVAGILGQVLLFLGNSYSVYMLGIGLIGLCLGGIVSSQLLVMMEVVHQENIPVASGLLLTVTGIVSVSTGPVFGESNIVCFLSIFLCFMQFVIYIVWYRLRRFILRFMPPF